MRITYITIASLSLSILIACNQKSGSGESDTQTEAVTAALETSYAAHDGEVFPMNIQKGGSFKSVDQIRVQAMGIINHRNQEEPKALAMLTYAFWNPEFVYNAGSISKVGDYEGYWIKFDDDFRYRCGINDKVTGGGRYHFRLEDKSLYMLDDNVEYEPKVWSVNYNGTVIAIAGRQVYKVNNGMQIKLVEMDNKPVI